MFNRKQNEIDRLNARAVELARMVKTQKQNNNEIIKENRKIRNENANLRCEIDELKDTLRRINQLMTCNQYNNSKVLKDKILELTSDYQSIS